MSRPAVSPGHCTCPSGWAEIGRRGTRLNRKAALWLLPLLRRLSPPCSPSKRNSHGATGGAEGRTAQGGDLMSLPRDGGGTIYSDLSMQAAADHRWRKTGLGATTEGERKGGLLAGAAPGTPQGSRTRPAVQQDCTETPDCTLPLAGGGRVWPKRCSGASPAVARPELCRDTDPESCTLPGSDCAVQGPACSPDL